MSGEEYGQNGCLEGDITQLLIFKDFLEWNEQKPYPIKQDFTKGDIKINYKLAGVQLNVMISADKTIFQQEPRETEAEIVIKSEDLAFKVLEISNLNNCFRLHVCLSVRTYVRT